MPVPFQFANQIGNIPLEELDDNFDYVLSNGLYAENSNVANTVSNPVQSGIRSVGTLTTLTVSGFTSVGSLATLGNVVTNAIYTNNYFYANGQPFSGGGGNGSNYGNSNVFAYLGSGSNVVITTTGNITTTANVSGNYILGNGAFLTGISGGGGSNYSNSNVFSYLGSNSNVVITTTGNITGNYIKGDGSQLTNLPNSNYGNSNVALYLATNFGPITAPTRANNDISNNVATTQFVANAAFNAGAYNDIACQIFLESGNVTNIIASGNVNSNFINATGNVKVDKSLDTRDLNATGVITVGQINQANIVLENNEIFATGNIVGGNMLSEGNIYVGDDVIANGRFYGDGSQLTDLYEPVDEVMATGNVNSANVVNVWASRSLRVPRYPTELARDIELTSTEPQPFPGTLVIIDVDDFSLGTLQCYTDPLIGNSGWSNLTGNVSFNTVTSSIYTQLAIYSDANVRDTAIPSPQNGMLIYVTGIGFQGYSNGAWGNLTLT